jgi:hypothetical protein
MTDYWNIRNEFYLMQCRKIAPDNHSNRIFNLNYQIQGYSRVIMDLTSSRRNQINTFLKPVDTN